VDATCVVRTAHSLYYHRFWPVSETNGKNKQACPPTVETRLFVPNTHGVCATACANNHYEVGGACVPCASVPAFRTAGFIYSYWNAPNAAPWWSTTPSALMQTGFVPQKAT
jgi:hypothetical protein